MSQANVERIIGVLATDEAVRRRFTADPRTLLEEMGRRGVELTECERWSLVHLDPHALAHFALAVGPRLQKADLEGGPDS
jgi:hypothetical protein